MWLQRGLAAKGSAACLCSYLNITEASSSSSPAEIPSAPSGALELRDRRIICGLTKYKNEEALECLEAYGAVFVPNLLSTDDLKVCLKKLEQLRVPDTQGVAMKGYVVEASPGRHHVDLRCLRNAERLWYERLADPLIPLINKYLAGSELTTTPSSLNPKLRLTQLQFVDSEPGSAAQIFHCDNTRKGLTVLIPLVDMTLDNGATELLLGTHALFNESTANKSDRPWASWASIVNLVVFDVMHGKFIKTSDESSSPPAFSALRALCTARGALIYDSRTIHRGGGNFGSLREPRPVLILRFDVKDTPPPGLRLGGALLVQWLAYIIRLGEI